MLGRKLGKTVISNEGRNPSFLRINNLQISPYGRNDKNTHFRPDTNQGILEIVIDKKTAIQAY